MSFAGSGSDNFTTELLLPAWRPASVGEMHAARRRMKRLARQLAQAYGTPDLGNLCDPLDEAIYILLTYQTDLPRARSVWGRLRARFPAWASVLAAPAGELEAIVAPSGFQRARVQLILQLLRTVQKRYGELSLRALQQLPNESAEAQLRELPGLDIKGARCVLLYSLDRPVFPVDSNTFRFMQRYGVVAPSARYRRKTTHNELQALVKPGDRHDFHVNLVVHGQRTCLPRTPKCGICPVRRGCSRLGVA